MTLTSRVTVSDLSDCPVETTLLIIRDKWTVLIMQRLKDGPTRFGDLKRSIDGLSPKVLTERLRLLEHYCIVERIETRDPDRSVIYRYTDLGWSLDNVIQSMWAWGHSYKEWVLRNKEDSDQNRYDSQRKDHSSHGTRKETIDHGLSECGATFTQTLD